MHTITVRRHVDASPGAVYDLLADPATYRGFPGVRHAELVAPGADSPFGVGAVRRIHIGIFRYDEEIIVAEPGARLDYRVIVSRPPLEHERGTVTFARTNRGCDVTWTSTYRVPVPVVGPLLARLGGRRMTRAFDDAIRIAGALASVQSTA